VARGEKITKNVRKELYLGQEWQEQRGRVFYLHGEITSGRVRAGRASQPKGGKYEGLKNGYRPHCVSTRAAGEALKIASALVQAIKLLSRDWSRRGEVPELDGSLSPEGMSNRD
jgi:hypothetical protein